MALSAYEIIKRSSPSLAKHFEESEGNVAKLTKEVNEIKKDLKKVLPTFDFCLININSISIDDYGYDYVIIPEHINGIATGKGVIVDIDSPHGYIAGSSYFSASRDFSSKKQIVLEYSDDYKISQSIFYLVKWSDTDIYMINVIKSVVGMTEISNTDIKIISLGNITKGTDYNASINPKDLINKTVGFKFNCNDIIYTIFPTIELTSDGEPFNLNGKSFDNSLQFTGIINNATSNPTIVINITDVME